MGFRVLFVAFFLFASPAVKGEYEKCPTQCDCSSSTGDKAVCTELPQEVGVFPSWVKHLEIKDRRPSNKFQLDESVFLNLGLKNVQTIDIVNSSLKSVDAAAFINLPDVKNIDLSNNNLILLHPNTFSNNAQLLQLVLSGNPLQLTQFLNQTVKHPHFINSDSLSELLLANCQLRQIVPFAFSNLINLELIDLSGNQLKYVRPDMFAKMESLDEVYLSDNYIQTIDSRSFDDVDDMTVLKLDGNPITHTDTICVSGLKTLDLSRCKLEELAQNSFMQVPEVSSLNLSSNAIGSIDPDAFTPLITLSYLDLSHNALTSLPPTLFSGNKKLEKLYLAGNRQLKKIPKFEGTFAYLYYYDLSDCGLVNVTREPLSQMKYLSTLNLSSNHITNLGQKALGNLRSLKVLDLSNNKLRSLSADDFSHNRELNKLYLNGNLFHHLGISVFGSLPKLFYLDISNCRLTSLWTTADYHVILTKKALKDLSYLDVSNNKLKKLHVYQFNKFQQLRVLDVSNNPIECTDEFTHLVQWIITENIRLNSTTTSHALSWDQEDNDESEKMKWSELVNDVCIATPASDAKVEHESVLHTDRSLSAELLEKDLKLKLEEDLNEDDPVLWPIRLITLSLAVLFFAVINLLALIVFRSRRTYRAVRTPVYTSPLDGHFQVRRGGRLQYQKLYEECSVPLPAPVHAQKMSFIFGKGKPSPDFV